MEMPRRNQPVRNQTARNQTVRPNQQRHPARRGFTLLELLVAITVIAVLAAFLLPAIQGIVGTTKDAAVRNEISQMESAIATFKQKFGIEPPSGITLCEDNSGWTNPANATSKALIQRMWPNFDFTMNAYDFNDNSATTDTFTLTGSECLVFFLGGVQKNGALYGFSKNPSDPFETTSTNREGPFFEFAPSRLKPTPVTANAPAKVYVDGLGGQTNPYVYLSSYDGQGYRVADIPASTNLSGPYLTASGGIPHKQKSFQIISPGADTFYSASMGSVVYDTSAASNNGLGTNKESYDNITNFAPGRLRP